MAAEMKINYDTVVFLDYMLQGYVTQIKNLHIPIASEHYKSIEDIRKMISELYGAAARHDGPFIKITMK